MRKFNIGDKVRVIGNCNNHHYEIGKEYIIKCFDSLCTEPNENGYAYNLDTNVGGDVIREIDMELVESCDAIKHTTTDITTTIGCYNKIFNKEEYNLYVKGEWNIDMKNEVLELWYTRNHNSIIDEYDKKEMEFNKSKELVIKYKEIIENFEKELEELYNCEENIEKNYIKDNNLSESMYKYKINYDKLNDEFLEEYVIERDNKLRELDELKREINAQLSLSTDLEYQLEVLTRYGVLDKKTKKMVN